MLLFVILLIIIIITEDGRTTQVITRHIALLGNEMCNAEQHDESAENAK